MRIPRQHLKRLMAGNRSDLHRIKSLFKKLTGGFVPEIVKMKPGDPGIAAGPGEVL